MKRTTFFAALVAGVLAFTFSTYADEITIGSGTYTWDCPLYTYFNKARTQTIYLASEIGGARIFDWLSLKVSTIPGQTMNNFTIRLKHTDLSDYSSSPAWETSGWTTVLYHANQTISSTGWVTFLFTRPFAYNGTQNLMVDISFNNSSHSTEGHCYCSSLGVNRSIYRGIYNEYYGDPLNWSNSNMGYDITTLFPNIKLGFGVQNVIFTPDGGTYYTEKNVVISCPTSGAIIHYTTSGIDPTESDPIIASGGSVYVDHPMTLKARAWKIGIDPSTVKSASYNIAVSAPFFSISGGTYNTEQNVIVTCATPGASIHYTTNGTDPTENDPNIPSGGAIYVDQSMIVKAKAWKAGFTPSHVTSVNYQLKVLSPVFTPDGGYYDTEQNVVITCPAIEATIRFTLDGSSPDNGTMIENGDSITVSVNPHTILKAQAFIDGWTSSAEKTAIYYQYGGGNGDSNNPYQIRDAVDLNNIGMHPEEWGKCFILTDNIDMSAYTGTQYNIIGNAATKFTGTFDGNGHVIRNLTYTTTDSMSYVGLFGYTNNAIIKDISLENVTVSTGGNYVGGLVGYLNYGTISGCCSTGSVNNSLSYPYYLSAFFYSGGMVGYQNYGTISDCYSLGSVNNFITAYNPAIFYLCTGGLVGYQNSGAIVNCYAGSSVASPFSESSYPLRYYFYAGGLVGSMSSGIIARCYSAGSVASSSSSSYSRIGGLVGSQYGGTITDCYNMVTVTSASSSLPSISYAGGLVGYLYSLSNTKIEKCYSIGQVSTMGSSDFKGDLFGYKDGGSGILSACFWDTQISGLNDGVGNLNPDPNGVTGMETEMMKTSSAFTSAGWDFGTIWAICEGTNYPRLQWQIPAGDFACPDGVGVEDLPVITECWLETVQARADINGDDTVDFEDVLKLSQNWLLTDCGNCNDADITDDGNVDELDLSLMSDQWLLEINSGCQMTDLNDDGRVDLKDWTIFAQYWMEM